jgi:hypothetical protein
MISSAARRLTQEPSLEEIKLSARIFGFRGYRFEILFSRRPADGSRSQAKRREAFPWRRHMSWTACDSSWRPPCYIWMAAPEPYFFFNPSSSFRIDFPAADTVFSGPVELEDAAASQKADHAIAALSGKAGCIVKVYCRPTLQRRADGKTLIPLSCCFVTINREGTIAA